MQSGLISTSPCAKRRPVCKGLPLARCRLRTRPKAHALSPLPRLTPAHVPVSSSSMMKTFAESQPETAMTLEEAVWIDPGRMSGTPCFRGTRLPVQQLFDWLADGVPLDEFVRDFEIDPRAAAAVLRVGSAAVKTAATQNPACTDLA